MSAAFGVLAACLRRLARGAGGFARSERGATAIEYGLIVSLIFIAILGAVNNFSSKTNDMYSTISSSMN